MEEEHKKDAKEKIFSYVQESLKYPPLVVWGAGATIPFGMPSMSDLNKVLGDKIPKFNSLNENLEKELDNEKYMSLLPNIRQVIWDKVKEIDNKILNDIINNSTKFVCIKTLIENITNTHPKVMTIVTTNYDRVLEYTMSYYGIKYTDGFDGKDLSEFNENLFSDKNIVNLIKVHGSLNWFKVNENVRFLSTPLNNEPIIIPPGKNKYRETYHSPYRELIQKSDEYIKMAKSFLVVGFGFNDEHLTPRIIDKINEGTPIVLITKEVTSTAKQELKRAKNYILFEDGSNDKTFVKYKNITTNNNEQTDTLDGNYWQLQNFIEII